MIGFEFTNMTLSLNHLRILSVPSLLCNPGETICLVGANGSGKSLVLECLCGLYEYKGKIDYFRVIKKTKTHLSLDTVRIGTMLQRVGFWPLARVHEIIDIMETINGREIEKDDFLQKIMKRKFKDLSVGERQYLLFTITINSKADIYVFDEPTMGLDAFLYEKVLNKIKNNNKSALITLHNFADVLSCADRCYFVCGGILIPLNIILKNGLNRNAVIELVRNNGHDVDAAKRDIILTKSFEVEDSRSVELMNREFIPLIKQSLIADCDVPVCLDLTIPSCLCKGLDEPNS